MIKDIKNIFYFFTNYYIKKKFKVIFYVMFLVLHKVSIIFIPLYSKKLIDIAVEGNNIKKLNYNGIIFSLIIVAFLIFLICRNYLLKRINLEVTSDLKKKAISKINKINYNEINKLDSGFFIQRIVNDIDVSIGLMIKDFSLLFVNISYVVVIIYLMLKISFLISLFLLVLIPVFITANKIYMPRIKKVSSKLKENNDDITTLIDEIKKGTLHIKVYNIYGYFKKVINKKIKRYFLFSKKNIKYHLIYDYFIVTGVMNLSYILIYWLGGAFVLENKLTPGSLFALTLFFSKLWGPTEHFLKFPRNFNVKIVSFYRLKKLFKMNEEDYERKNNTNIDEVENIEIKNLFYSHDDIDIFKGINLKIKKGQKILIKGENGSGKSTLLKLLVRLYEPKKGKIFLNGINYKEYNLNDLRNNIVLIPQNSFIFKGTINKNIYFNNYKKNYVDTSEKLLKENIGKKNVLESGNNLSGGEKKIIQLIRGIEKESNFYLLDEPLNNVDKGKRKYILKLIVDLFKDKTLVIISHYNSFDKIADKIYKIKDYNLIKER